VLFLLWSNSFVAMSYLLGTERHPARLDWVGLASARFAPVTVICIVYLATFRRRETLHVIQHRFLRCLAGGLLAVTAYSLCLYWGMQRGIPAPVASLLTALSPLYLMILGAAVLGERLTARKLVGFAVALVGLGAVSASRGGFTLAALAPIGVAALAPLGFAIQTTLSKPISREVLPDVWTACYLVLGGLPLCLALPWAGGAELLTMDGAGWSALAFLGLGCTLAGFALWSWLLVHLPASTLGFTVFLNPPLALASQLVLATLFPATFVFHLSEWELGGCGVVLMGLWIAVRGQPHRKTA
jgi:drug/metabolite transporter (DMT)-like permease